MIEHDLRNQRFRLKLGAYEAVLMYARKGKQLDFYHIYVPEPFRNQGKAYRILKAAFEYAEKENLRVIPSCPFIRDDFLPRFPEHQKQVDAGEFPFFSQSKK